MLSTLAEVGLVYKNRHGKYSLAVPLARGVHPAPAFE
jgi:DNA-binding IclR family transcriptional regulator